MTRPTGARWQRPWRSPHEAPIGANWFRRVKSVRRHRVHHEGNATVGQERGVAGVIFVVVRENGRPDPALVEIARDGLAGLRKAAVDENAVDEICAHVHAGRATTPAREAHALDISVALDLDHFEV